MPPRITIHNHLPAQTAKDAYRTIKVIARSKVMAMQHAENQVPTMKPIDAHEIDPGHWIVKLEKV